MAIGKVVKVFGVQGDLIVLPMTDNPGRFKKLKSVYVGPSEDQAVDSRVTIVSVSPRGVRLKFALADNRTAAEKLIGWLLFVDQQHAIRLPKGTFFVHDLLGLTVVDDENHRVGTVTDVLKYPANDIYVVDCDGKELLVPAVKEFIRHIDLESHTMRVHLIEGMRE